jgi:lipopolysaccharide export system protein LptA
VYEGKTRMATLYNNVKCVEKEMVLTTDLLTFDVGRSIASYFNGGTIVHRENTLVSKNGHYYSSGKEAAFHYDVVLTNPEYKMESDTLRYRITNKTSYFLGPSIITSKTDYIYCENGWYDTGLDKAQFSKNAVLVTSAQKLRGDSLLYDRNTRIGKAFRNVTLVDTSHKSILYGDYIEYRQLKSEGLATGKPLYVRLVDKDSLFVAADTLYHTEPDSVNRFLNAFHHVRIFKKDLQAICDSATISTGDSLLRMYHQPFLWNGNMQATARHIRVEIGEKSVKGFALEGKAFVAQQLDSLKMDKFNQVTARTITGLVREDSIRRINATGNAEIYYYPKNKNKIEGLNKTTTEEVILWFEKGQPGRATMKPQTNGEIVPLNEVNAENARLKGFDWQPGKRPLSRYDLHHSKPGAGK